MPRSAGVYNLPEAAFVGDTVIDEAAVNNNFSDIGSEITNSIAADGQTNPTANLPMDGYKHTGVGNANARDQYAVMGQVQDGAGIWCGTAGGTADALTLTPSPAITAYAAGQRFDFVSSAANTGAATVAVSGLAATAIQVGAAALSAGDIPNGARCSVQYDGTQFQLHGVSQPGGLSSVAGDASPQLGGALDTNGQAINYSEGSAVASASAPNIWATDGNTVHVTGTTTITDFADAPRIGASRWLVFDGALTLTHGSGITLPGSANITTAAGDMAYVYADAVDAFRVVYFKASGVPVSGSWPTPDFTSSEQTVATDTLLTVAHGLGVLPKNLRVVLRCKTAQIGYAVDEEVLVSGFNTSGLTDTGVTFSVDGTNIYAVQGERIQLIQKSGGTAFNAGTITPASWRWVFEAWS